MAEGGAAEWALSLSERLQVGEFYETYGLDAVLLIQVNQPHTTTVTAHRLGGPSGLVANLSRAPDPAHSTQQT